MQAKTAAKAALAVSLAVGAFLARSVIYGLFMSLLLAALIAYLLMPVQRLYERRLNPKISAALALLTAALAVGVPVYLTIPRLIEQIAILSEKLPALYEKANEIMLSVSDFLGGISIPSEMMQFPDLTAIASGIAGMGKYMLSPVFAYYFLSDRVKLFDSINRWIPSAHRGAVIKCAIDMRTFFASYLRGQILICLVTGVLTAIGLAIVGVEAYLPLGAMMAVFNIIPYFGPIIGIVPVLIFSLTQGVGTALWAVGAAFAAQQIESALVSPHVMAGTAGFHPGVVVALIFSGGALWGVWGMLLVIPLAMLVKTVWLSILSSRLYPARHRRAEPLSKVR